MAIELGLRTLLLQQPAIVALVPPQPVGNPTFDCVFNEFAPQGVKPPFIVIYQINFDPMKALDGTYGMETTELDVDCHHITHPGAVKLGKTVSDFLKDYTGLAGGQDRINAVLWESKRHDRIYLNDGRDVRENILSMTFTIQHSPLY